MNTEALEILNREYNGSTFQTVADAARALLVDHLSALGEHGPAYALEIAYAEGRESIAREVRFVYDFNADQVEAVADVWDDVIEYLTEEVERPFDTSFDAENLPF